jgi:hypothetical protein
MQQWSQIMWKFVCLSALMIVLTAVVGCGRYATVGPEAYQYTKALYSVCNRHDLPRLTRIAQQIDIARIESQLTAAEADWLNDIIAVARAGRWQEATRDARQLMEAQVAGL